MISRSRRGICAGYRRSTKITIPSALLTLYHNLSPSAHACLPQHQLCWRGRELIVSYICSRLSWIRTEINRSPTKSQHWYQIPTNADTARASPDVSTTWTSKLGCF